MGAPVVEGGMRRCIVFAELLSFLFLSEFSFHDIDVFKTNVVILFVFFFLLFVQTMCCISRFDSGVFWLSVQVSGDGGCTIVFGNFHSLRLRVLAL